MNKKILILTVLLVAISFYSCKENDNYLENIRKILPPDWEIFSYEEDIVEPTHWLKGKGKHILLQRKEFTPEDWKRGLVGRISIWIMSKDYEASHDLYCDVIPYPAQVGPAREIEIWNNHRVFLWGSPGKDWPNWEEDIISVFGKKLIKKNNNP